MQNTKTFSLEIEKMAQEKSISHMDAVLEYCKKKELETKNLTLYDEESDQYISEFDYALRHKLICYYCNNSIINTEHKEIFTDRNIKQKIHVNCIPLCDELCPCEKSLEHVCDCDKSY